MPTKTDILIKALIKISLLDPTNKKANGRLLAKVALREYREAEKAEIFEAEKRLEELASNKYKSTPCRCKQLNCNNLFCCGQCGCVSCFLSDRKTEKANPAANLDTNNAA